MIYNVYNGEYPFDILVGTIQADDDTQALEVALKEFNQYPHCVVEPVEIPGVLQ